MSKTLSAEQVEKLLTVLAERFNKNQNRHPKLKWESVYTRLIKYSDKLWSLHQMEFSGGEPDVIEVDEETGAFIFYDCSEESPKERRSCCYDSDALNSRKENKPKFSAEARASEMGVRLLTEQEYHKLQSLGNFDLKTSSWLATPMEIRKLGGAIFGDKRFGRAFVYHNGAESYYAARGFRTYLMV